MLTLPPGVRVFVATERVDGRKGIDGLSVLGNPSVSAVLRSP